MPQNRYYVPEPFTQDQVVSIGEPEFHYLKSVMRAVPGDEVELINGQGELAKAQVVEIQKKEALCQIKAIHKEKKPDRSLRLALGLLKTAHLEFALEKACEIGVDAITLFIAKRSEKKEVSEQYLKRLESIVIAACKQSGRLFLPQIEVKKSLKECNFTDALAFFGDLSPTAQPVSSFAEKLKSAKAVSVFIGPESGFSEDELKLLHEKGALGARLAKNTLRAETAAIAACLLFSLQA